MERATTITFFASFRVFRCFAALAFSILCRRRTGVRFDFGSVKTSGYTPVEDGIIKVHTARLVDHFRQLELP